MFSYKDFFFSLSIRKSHGINKITLWEGTGEAVAVACGNNCPPLLIQPTGNPFSSLAYSAPSDSPQGCLPNRCWCSALWEPQLKTNSVVNLSVRKRILLCRLTWNNRDGSLSQVFQHPAWCVLGSSECVGTRMLLGSSFHLFQAQVLCPLLPALGVLLFPTLSSPASKINRAAAR